MSQTTAAEVVKPAAPVAVGRCRGRDRARREQAPRRRRSALAVETSLGRTCISTAGGGAFISRQQRGPALLVFAARTAGGRPPRAVARVARAACIRTPYVVRFPDDDREPDGHAEGRRSPRRSPTTATRARHIGVYLLKVNQRRSVVDTVVKARARSSTTASRPGSKPELLLAMAQPPLKGSLLVCNGYKDREFMRMALPRGRARAPRDHRARVDPRGPALPRRRPRAGLDREAARSACGQAVQPRQRPLAELGRREQQVRPRRTNELLAVVRELTDAGRARAAVAAALPHRLADHPDQAHQDGGPRRRPHLRPSCSSWRRSCATSTSAAASASTTTAAARRTRRRPTTRSRSTRRRWCSR